MHFQEASMAWRTQYVMHPLPYEAFDYVPEPALRDDWVMYNMGSEL